MKGTVIKIMTFIGDINYFDWVKKLGQWHLNDDEYKEGETLCGAPMLGNNYHGKIDPKDIRKCPQCFAIAEARKKERL